MYQDRQSSSILSIKQQIISQETLLEYHWKIEAMIEMLLMNDLTSYSIEKLHTYIWSVHDLVCKAKDLNQELVSSLVRVAHINKRGEK